MEKNEISRIHSSYARKKVKTIESCFRELFFVNGYCELRVKVTPPLRRKTLALSNYICILQNIYIKNKTFPSPLMGRNSRREGSKYLARANFSGKKGRKYSRRIFRFYIDPRRNFSKHLVWRRSRRHVRDLRGFVTRS